MEKLKLEHLVPYLPYGLRMIFEGKGGREIILSSITNQGKYGVVISGGTGSMWLNSCGFKPILRPLSDLTKKIEHNGEKFVPLQKLCRLFAYKEQYKKDWTFNSDENYAFNGGSDINHFDKELVYFCSASDPIMNREFGYYSISKKFYLRNNRDKEDLTHVVNQYDAIQKLFEWHFDVFGLIDKGLAIDINTIK